MVGAVEASSLLDDHPGVPAGEMQCLYDKKGCLLVLGARSPGYLMPVQTLNLFREAPFPNLKPSVHRASEVNAKNSPLQCRAASSALTRRLSSSQYARNRHLSPLMAFHPTKLLMGSGPDIIWCPLCKFGYDPPANRPEKFCAPTPSSCSQKLHSAQNLSVWKGVGWSRPD